MLTERQGRILKLIVGDYVSTGLPVGSVSIAQRHGLGISSATIRNEMADLEEEGYILHRHPSAGRVPSDKGYRYYVEALMEETDLPPTEKLTVRHQFHQSEMELEEWSRLAAAVLAGLVKNVALVTLPRAPVTHWKHLELVSLQELLALLILVLREAKLRQQFITFEEPVSQDTLSSVANRLNTLYSHLTWAQIRERAVELSALEEQVLHSAMYLMQAESVASPAELYLDGLRYIFAQPEFMNQREKMRQVVEVLEDRRVLGELVSQTAAEPGVQVIIGRENPQNAMGEYSVVLTSYGNPFQARGVLGVMGPTRMPYERVIPSVRYMGMMMSELLAELYT